MKKIIMGMIGGGTGPSSEMHTAVLRGYVMTSYWQEEFLVLTIIRANNLLKMKASALKGAIKI
jgi:hypothetical protein